MLSLCLPLSLPLDTRSPEMLGTAWLRRASGAACRLRAVAPPVRCSRCLSSSAARPAGSSTEELGINWEREVGNHFQPQSGRIQRGGPYPGSDNFFKKTRIRVSNLARDVTGEQLHQLFASIDPAESRSVGETQIHVSEPDAEGARLVTLPEELYSRAMLLSGAELEGVPLVIELSEHPKSVADSAAVYGWEWSALGSGSHDNAAWAKGKGPHRALSSARYWGIVPDLLPQPPKLSVHLSCSWPSGGTDAAAFRGNTVRAEVLSSGNPTLQWPADGVAEQATGGLTLIMSVLPPEAPDPELASSDAGSVWHGWVVANMNADGGEEARGDVVMPYQLSSGDDEECPSTAWLRPGARVVFALYAQQAAIGACASPLVSSACLSRAHMALRVVCVRPDSACFLLRVSAGCCAFLPCAFGCMVSAAIRSRCLDPSDSSC